VSAAILRGEIKRYGATWKAVAAYHTPPNKNPERGYRYAKAVFNRMKKLAGRI